jgi:hypothetical protein
MVDLNMGYYAMPLDNEAKKLCVISLPWGLFLQYQVLPQGIKPATDIFQQRMNALYHNMSNIDTFLDNSMLLGYSTFSNHLETVIEVLKRLLHPGMQINVKKCKWLQHCVAYLRLIITREGIKPHQKKFKASST